MDGSGRVLFERSAPGREGLGTLVRGLSGKPHLRLWKGLGQLFPEYRHGDIFGGKVPPVQEEQAPAFRLQVFMAADLPGEVSLAPCVDRLPQKVAACAAADRHPADRLRPRLGEMEIGRAHV